MSQDVQNLPDMSDNAVKVMELVEGMTVLELADLVKNMEDKFGVSAAAPVAAVAVAGGDAGAEEAEEKSAYNIELKDAGSNKIAVIKIVKEIADLGLMEAKGLVEGAPATIKETVPTADAEEIKAKLEEAGATVELS